jgi:hypothetical protein
VEQNSNKSILNKTPAIKPNYSGKAMSTSTNKFKKKISYFFSFDYIIDKLCKDDVVMAELAKLIYAHALQI